MLGPELTLVALLGLCEIGVITVVLPSELLLDGGSGFHVDLFGFAVFVRFRGLCILF